MTHKADELKARWPWLAMEIDEIEKNEREIKYSRSLYDQNTHLTEVGE